jgi:hypothetical protein
LHLGCNGILSVLCLSINLAIEHTLSILGTGRLRINVLLKRGVGLLAVGRLAVDVGLQLLLNGLSAL